MQHFFRRRIFWLFALLLVAGVFVILWLANPRAELLTTPPEPRKPRFGFLGPWASPVRTQWHKIKVRLFGSPPNVLIESEIFAWLPNVPSTTNFTPSHPLLSDSQGTRVWLIDTNAARALHESVAQHGGSYAQPRVVALDGMPLQIVAGDAGDGIQWGQVTLKPRLYDLLIHCVAHVSGNAVDLTWFLTRAKLEENPAAQITTNRFVLRTNFFSGVRVQIPSGKSLFLLNTNSGNERPFGAIVSTTVLDQRK